MTSFMMPHVYGRLIPENLNLVLKNDGVVNLKINYTLANYLSMASKASEQYSEIWDTMSKITNMYENLGDKPKIYYDTCEILNIFKLDIENTATEHNMIQNDHNMIQTVIESIYNSKKGNNAIIKIGNIFSQVSVDCVYILSLCFNEVYIYKPASSPAISSEKYVVCKDFKLISTEYLKPVFNKILYDLKMSQTGGCVSLYTRRINNNYMNTLIEANSVIGQQQLEAINNTITLIEQGKKREKIEALKRQQITRCSEWHKKFGVNGQQYSQEMEM